LGSSELSRLPSGLGFEFLGGPATQRRVQPLGVVDLGGPVDGVHPIAGSICGGNQHYEFSSSSCRSKSCLASWKRSAFSTIQVHSGTMRTSRSMPVSESSCSTLGGLFEIRTEHQPVTLVPSQGARQHALTNPVHAHADFCMPHAYRTRLACGQHRVTIGLRHVRSPLAASHHHRLSGRHTVGEH